MHTDLTKFQKLMLINAYPVKLIFNSVGGIIALYFLWKHELLFSLIFGAIFIFGGTLLSLTNKTSLVAIAETFLGKIFIQYSTIWGFVCYSISHTLIPLSFWYHNIYLAVVGIFILLAGLIKLKL